MNLIATTLLTVVAHKMNKKGLFNTRGLDCAACRRRRPRGQAGSAAWKIHAVFKRIKGAEWDNSEVVKALVNDIHANCKNSQVLYLAD